MTNRLDMLHKGMIQIPGRMEQYGARTQNDTQFNTDELFICGTFHLVFSDLLTVGN